LAGADLAPVAFRAAGGAGLGRLGPPTDASQEILSGSGY
jgi:hypothetical protein